MKSEFVKIVSDMQAGSQVKVMKAIVNRLSTVSGVPALEISNGATFFSDRMYDAERGRKLTDKQINAALSNIENRCAGLKFIYQVGNGNVGFKAEKGI